MTPYEQHLQFRKQLKRMNLLSNAIVTIILVVVFWIDYLRVFGG